MLSYNKLQIQPSTQQTGLNMHSRSLIPSALFFAATCFTLGPAGPAELLRPKLSSELAPTPPMGWNSWDCFGMDVTEEQVKANADYMAHYMKVSGWVYIVVDMGWYFGEGVNTTNFKAIKNPPQYMDEYGRLMPSVRKFPSAVRGRGLRVLADYVHGLGLKFGLHILRGIPWQAVEENIPIKGSASRAKDIVNPAATCTWYDGLRGLDMSKSSAQEYYKSLIELYAEWGVDYIKADDLERPYYRDDIAALRHAITERGRPMVLSLSAGPVSVGEIQHLRANAELWRISGDVWDDWGIVKRQFETCRLWQGCGKPNHWPDCDILPLGKLRINGTDDIVGVENARKSGNRVNEYSCLSTDEKYTLLTLWYMFRSPLFMGGNLPENDDLTLQMLTNEEALAVNIGSTNNHELRRSATEVIWVGDDPATGVKYLAMFNIGDVGVRSVNVTWKEVGLAGECEVRDLWKKVEVGNAHAGIGVTIAPHGAALYKITKR